MAKSLPFRTWPAKVADGEGPFRSETPAGVEHGPFTTDEVADLSWGMPSEGLGTKPTTGRSMKRTR